MDRSISDFTDTQLLTEFNKRLAREEFYELLTNPKLTAEQWRNKRRMNFYKLITKFQIVREYKDTRKGHIIKPEKVYLPELSGFEISEIQTLEGASKNYIINAISPYESIDEFVVDFRGVAEDIIIRQNAKVNTIKSGYIVQVNYVNKEDEERHLFYRQANLDTYLEIFNFNENYNTFTEYLRTWIQEREEGESDLVFQSISQVQISIVRIEILGGSSYIPFPYNCNTVLNVMNEDTRCFPLSILAHLHPVDGKSHPNRPSKYLPFMDELNLDGIEMPVKLDDIKKFERQNPSIAVNVFGLEHRGHGSGRDNFSITPLRISKEENREHNIDLVYLCDDAVDNRVEEDTEVNAHYCLIKNFDSFASGNKDHKHVCRRCLNSNASAEALENHMKTCKKHKECRIVMPDETNNKLKFMKYVMKSRLPFMGVADFEALNVPIQSASPNDKKSYQEKKMHQQASCYTTYIHSDYEKIVKSKYSLFRGKTTEENVKHFVDYIIGLNKEMYGKLRPCHKYDKASKKYIYTSNLLPLSPEEQNEYDNATKCFYCEEILSTEENSSKLKVLDHNHFTGRYRGASCSDCNIREGKATKFVPFFFHNLKGYDARMFIKELAKQSNSTNQKLKILAKNEQDYISFQFGCIRFLDSLAFFAESLDNVVKSLQDEDLKITKKVLSQEFDERNGIAKSKEECDANKEKFEKEFQLLRTKGVYPYDWVDSFNKFNRTKLPPIE